MDWMDLKAVRYRVCIYMYVLQLFHFLLYMYMHVFWLQNLEPATIFLFPISARGFSKSLWTMILIIIIFSLSINFTYRRMPFFRMLWILRAGINMHDYAKFAKFTALKKRCPTVIGTKPYYHFMTKCSVIVPTDWPFYANFSLCICYHYHY